MFLEHAVQVESLCASNDSKALYTSNDSQALSLPNQQRQIRILERCLWKTAIILLQELLRIPSELLDKGAGANVPKVCAINTQ